MAELTTERDQAMQETKQVSLELEEALNVADAEAETTQHMLQKKLNRMEQKHQRRSQGSRKS